MGVAREDFSQRVQGVRKKRALVGNYSPMISEKEFQERHSMLEEVFLMHNLCGEPYRMALEKLNQEFLQKSEQEI